jgi:hypothetical protein
MRPVPSGRDDLDALDSSGQPAFSGVVSTRGEELRCATVTYMPRSTSYRLTEETRARLSRQADREGITATALLDRLITEGIDAIDHPGVVHHGPPHDRRAALAGGPDVWEVVARLRDLDGGEEERIRVLAEESALHPRSIRVALDYAAANAEGITARIEANEQAIRDSQSGAEARQTLLA